MAAKVKYSKRTRKFPPIVGFWDPGEGAFEGVLLKRVDGDNPYWLFKALAKASVKSTSDANRRFAEPGEIFGVSSAAGLDVQINAEEDIGYAFRVSRGAEKQTNEKNGREFWPYSVEVSDTKVG